MTGMVERYTLYKDDWCPFCRRVQAFVAEAGLDIPMRDTFSDAGARAELVAGGGRATVPCLKIEVSGEERWLYESADIIGHLRSHAPAKA